MAAATVLNPNLIQNSDLKLPSDYVLLPQGYHPKPKRFVGLLACQMNPLLKSYDTTVTRIEKKVIEVVKGNKSKKKDQGKNEGTSEVDWEIECEDTVIFPEGGGQPCDHGAITLIASGHLEQQTIKVVDAFRRKLDAVHVFRFPAAADPSSFGWVVGASVHIEVDWDRRTYHMQQHTGQHLLSAVFEHDLKNNTLGWMLSQSDQPSYVDLERSPSQIDIDYVTKRCNELIQVGRRVRVEVRLDSEHERPGTVPEDYRDGVIRYVTIDDLDVNPCCGTHGPSLALLGSVFIYPGVTNISGPTRFRIYFAVGNAVLHHLANAFGVVKIVGAALECGAPDVAERLATLQKARKDGQKREKALRAEAARLYAMDLTSSLHETSNGVIVGNVHREDESTDIELLTLIFNSFQPPEGKKWLVSLSSGPIGFGGGCLLLAGSDEALVKKTGELVKTRLKGRVRGGGGKGRWQGKVVENWQKDDRVLLGKVIEEASLA